MVQLNMTTSPSNALQTINNLTIVNGVPLFALTILFFIWIIIFMRTKEKSVRHAIAGASFFTSIIGIIFAFLGLFPNGSDIYVGMLVGIAILSFIPLTNK